VTAHLQADIERGSTQLAEEMKLEGKEIGNYVKKKGTRKGRKL
jgi:hypothetical protein